VRPRRARCFTRERLNDLVCCPSCSGEALLAGNPTGTGRAALNLFRRRAGAGIAVGFVGVVLLDRMRRWVGVRDYESLYALGLAFTAYAVGKSRTAAVSRGVCRRLTIAASDAELRLLPRLRPGRRRDVLAVHVRAFGSSLIWTGLTGVTGAVCSSAILALGLRSAVLAVALPRKGSIRAAAG